MKTTRIKLIVDQRWQIHTDTHNNWEFFICTLNKKNQDKAKQGSNITYYSLILINIGVFCASIITLFICHYCSFPYMLCTTLHFTLFHCCYYPHFCIIFCQIAWISKLLHTLLASLEITWFSLHSRQSNFQILIFFFFISICA